MVGRRETARAAAAAAAAAQATGIEALWAGKRSACRAGQRRLGQIRGIGAANGAGASSSGGPGTRVSKPGPEALRAACTEQRAGWARQTVATAVRAGSAGSGPQQQQQHHHQQRQRQATAHGNNPRTNRQPLPPRNPQTDGAAAPLLKPVDHPCARRAAARSSKLCRCGSPRRPDVSGSLSVAAALLATATRTRVRARLRRQSTARAPPLTPRWLAGWRLS